MPHGYSGGKKSEPVKYKVNTEKLVKALIIEEVKVVEVPRVYEVPTVKFIEKEQIKYITKEEEQVKYNTVTKETIQYTPRQVENIKYVLREEETIKYNTVEVKVEKPVIVETPYEKPIITEKKYTVATVDDMAVLRELLASVPRMVQELKILKEELNGLRKYKLVEKVVIVPKIQWNTVDVERIVWKDVEREKPS